MSLSLFPRLARRFGKPMDELTRRDVLRASIAAGAGLLLSSRMTWAQERRGGKRVVVIGAGFAGLAAAHELIAAGYDVSVVEARKRLGGRVLTFTDWLSGRVIEGGAELIGDNHPAWQAYAERFKLKMLPMTDDEELSYPVYLDGKLLSDEEAEQVYEELEALQTKMSGDAERINADEPWDSPDAQSLDRRSLADWITAAEGSALVKKAMTVEWTANSGVPTARQSYLGFLATIKGGTVNDINKDYWNLTETCRCEGGNQQLAAKLADAIGAARIQLGLAVTGIQVNAGGCKVRCADDRTYECDDVVLATPPGTWKKIKIEPGLPDAIKPQMGVNVKYLANVKKRFWLDRKLSQYALADLDVVNMTWDATDAQEGDENICLTSFSGGPTAEAARAKPEGGRDAAYKADLEKVLPGFGENFVQSRFMDWPGEAWTQAGYSFPAPGEVTTVGPLLRKGHGGRLHFAGEHTCYKFAGYMEGGLHSGISVAARIAKRDGVTK